MLALKVKKAQAGLWWLSLENFLERRHIWGLHDKVRYLKRVIQGRRPWGGAKSLKQILHFSQTEHSSSYLRSCGIEPIPLIDSINEDFLTDRFLDRIDHKQNSILYNPTKGWKVTESLIKAYPDWRFVPVKGLNREQLSEKLYQAKLYIDFGHHPGKDRLPREAAIHGCCVITGLYGSASNNLDVNIPSSYKIDPQVKSFLDAFKEKVGLIFNDFEKCFAEFSEYRKTISQEQVEFEKQINQIFSIPSK
jgi:hypothetical protein